MSIRHRWILSTALTLAASIPLAARAQDVDAGNEPEARAHESSGDLVDQDAQVLPVIPVVATEPARIDPPGGGRDTHLEEMIVTATKRAQPLREIAATINVVDGRALEKLNAKELADFLKLVPGVTQNSLGSDQNRLTIRGVGADTSRLTTSQTAAILIGDTAFSDPMLSAVSPDMNPFDLDSVEILKGPQGTLFGSAGLSGAIRYVPTPPEPGSWQAKAALSYGTTAEGAASRSLDTALNVPLAGSDTAALRLVYSGRRSGGVIDDLSRGLENVDSRLQDGGRALLVWTPGERLSANAMYLRQDSRMDDLNFADNREGRLERNTTPGPSHQRSAFDLANLTLAYRFDSADLTSTTSRVTKTYDAALDVSRILGVSGLGIDAVRLGNVQAVRSWMQELRLASPPGEWEWLVGIYGLDYQQDFEEVLSVQTPLGPLPGSLGTLVRAIADIELREASAFGNVSRSLGESLRLELGLRYYRVRTRGSSVSSGPLILVATGSPSNTNIADIPESGVNPKLALSWFASRHFMSYLSVARGFRTGAIQIVGDTPTTDVPDSYKSDTLWNYELGLRSDWFDRSLFIDFAVFYIDWRDPQMVQRTSDNLFNFIDNVGGARIPGAELTLSYAPQIEGLTLRAVAAYSQPRTTKPFEAPDGTPVPVGTPLPGTADWQTSLILSYAREWSGWQGDAQLTHAYTGPAYNDLLRHSKVLGYQTWDLRLTLGRSFGALPVSLSLLGSNLTDERGIANIVYTSEELQDVYYIRPRTLELRLALSF